MLIATVLMSTVAANVALGVLVASGAAHVLRNRAFIDQLRAQRVWRAPGATVLAGVVTAAELGIGGVGGVVLIAGPTSATPLQVALALAAGMYAVYTIYLWWLHRNTERPVPCGCSPTAVPVSAWSVGRAGVLAVASGMGLAAADTIVGPLDPAGLAPLLASLPIGIGLWILPEALAPVSIHQIDQAVPG